MLAWLREHVHPIGRALNAEQLVEQVSGRALSAQPFLAYLEAKIGRLSPAMSGSS
jgi:carboxypeptidase Taq